MSKQPKVDIQQELQATSYGQHREQVTQYTNGMMMNLTVDQVMTYDKNPRREINPEYEQIKASIKKRGMDQVLSVTQRPSDPNNQFMIVHGGNTRLQILKELYAETQDTKFQHLQCRYVTWESESDALIGHLIENDARGDYSFIDRAIGIINAKTELEKEAAKELSSRGLIVKLKEQGYKLSRIDLYRMSYAVDFLYPVIPIILDGGIGPRQIDAIQKLDKYALELFLELQNTRTPDDWKKEFSSALSQQNKISQWSYDDLYTDTLLILASNDIAESNRLSFILSARLEGLKEKETASSEVSTAITPSDNQQQANKNNETDIPASQPLETQAVSDHQSIPKSENTGAKAPSSSEDDESATPQTSSKTSNTSATRTNTLDASASTSDFTPSLAGFTQENLSSRQLRDRIFSEALQLASDNGFGGLIEPLPNLGVGFILKDLPSKNFMEGEKLFGILKKRPYKERIMVWWMLFGFSELRVMSMNNPNAIAPLLPETDLKRALFNEASHGQDKCNMTLERLFRRTGEFIIDDLVVYFWAVASESNMKGMLVLQQLYRQLNEALDYNLWEIKS